MEVLQFEVLESVKGWFIALYDEVDQEFNRVSDEFYPKFNQAQLALFTGAWTPA